MRSAIETAARLVTLQEPRLPDWCDRFLGDAGDFFASRLWYDTVLAHALPKDAEPLLAICGDDALTLPLLRQGRHLGALTTPYSLEWRPLPAPGLENAALRQAGRGLAGLLRRRPPTRLDALDPTARGLAPMVAGLGEAGISTARYDHFGNWREVLAPGTDWEAYHAARPPALRNTIRRKLGRAQRFTLHTAPGAGLERAILAYLTVRESSWKPPEPFPHFDAALLRATAAAGVLRLGVLWDAEARPIAAQYWMVGGGRAWLLKLVHDEASRAASPGTVLTALMIRALLDEDGVRELDFGRGDDAYKRLWVAERRQRVGLVLTDPWHPAGLLELARQAASRGRRMLRARLAGGEAS